jgi:hypothetical protein
LRFAKSLDSITLQPVGGKRELVVEVRFTVNLGELRRACRRLVSRLSDESEIETDFALFNATGRALKISTKNSSEVLDATVHRSGQATVPRPVFCKLVSTLRYFRGTEIEFEFSAGMIVLNGRTQIHHSGISSSDGLIKQPPVAVPKRD